MGRHRTAGAGSGSCRTPLIHPAPFRAPRILLVVIGRRSASASASPSRGPGNGILRAETGGRFQAQNAGERPDFGSQTANCLTNRPELLSECRWVALDRGMSSGAATRSRCSPPQHHSVTVPFAVNGQRRAASMNASKTTPSLPDPPGPLRLGAHPVRRFRRHPRAGACSDVLLSEDETGGTRVMRLGTLWKDAQ